MARLGDGRAGSGRLVPCTASGSHLREHLWLHGQLAKIAILLPSMRTLDVNSMQRSFSEASQARDR